MTDESGGQFERQSMFSGIAANKERWQWILALAVLMLILQKYIE